jgi:hypothetical protein
MVLLMSFLKNLMATWKVKARARNVNTHFSCHARYEEIEEHKTGSDQNYSYAIKISIKNELKMVMGFHEVAH